ncbi:MAG: 4Fe-4S binding protein [Clostridiales bacterium]|nr:4Fe-4S binding protein [Clostridiales bacterium]
MAYIIDKEKCVNCGYCEFVCPFSAISALDDYYTIDENKCVNCAQCFDACINCAISPGIGVKRIQKVEIISENCIGCSLCKRFCPANAVEGVIKQPFTIIQEKCIKCGVCFSKCKKDAVLVVYR